MSNDQGATASYRGYRLQALYSLTRIFEENNDDSAVFHLEGNEDLDIEINGQLVESIQVKSTGNFSLSDLTPQKKDSFFHRVMKLLQMPTIPQIKIVNFGSFGKEMRLAFAGDENHRSTISKKLQEKGFGQKEIADFFKYIKIIGVNEDELKLQIETKLRELVIDPEGAFDILNNWLFRGSEKKAKITRLNLIERVNSIARFLNERNSYLKEFYTTIRPLESDFPDEDKLIKLKKEFYEGVSAKYEHILADLDFYREEKIDQIRRLFEVSNCVVIHAASGQGKTALAYRYLHNTYPSNTRFLVQGIDNKQTALSIAAALSGYTKNLQTPMALLIDVSSTDTEWHYLARELALNQYLHILICIREEDYRRTIIPSNFEYKTIDLFFNEEEARVIYNRFLEQRRPLEHLSFEEAWNKFNSGGPLLEFVYLLTNSETLQKRLCEQLKRINSEVRGNIRLGDEINILRIVALASAYGARIRLSEILKLIPLPAPYLTLQTMEEEYLLITTPDNKYLTGLHPIRSKIIFEILSQPAISPWIETFRLAIKLIPEDDLESFIMLAFIDRENESKEIVDIILTLELTTSIGIVGILRCLIWIGVKEYLIENREIIDSIRSLWGESWYLIMDLNFAGEEIKGITGWWNEFDNIPDSKKRETANILKIQTSNDRAFIFAKPWLSYQKSPLNKPANSRDWLFVAEILYWVYRFDLPQKVNSLLSEDVLSTETNNVPLRELSEFSLSLYLSNTERYEYWFNKNKNEIEERLAKELGIISIIKENDLITIHFLTYPAAETGTNPYDNLSLHERTIERIQILRNFYPQYDKYASKGYGHQLNFLGIDNDETIKTGIPYKSLAPQWAIRFNSIAIGLENYRHRLNTWDEYINKILELRRGNIKCLGELTKAINRYFQNEKPFNFFGMDVFTSGQWDKCIQANRDIPLLPKIAVDKWGISHPEDKGLNENEELKKSKENKELYTSILERLYHLFIRVQSDLHIFLYQFMKNSYDVILTNRKCGKLPSNSPQKKQALYDLKNNNIDTRTNNLTIVQLSRIKEDLVKYQSHFHELFDNTIDRESVIGLDNAEKDIINHLSILWYYFVNYPRLQFSDPKKQIPKEISSAVLKLKYKYEMGMRELSNKQMTATNLNINVPWDNSSAIWIKINIDDALDFYTTLEQAILVFRRSLGKIDASDIYYKLIEEYYGYTVFVITVKGKLINKLFWPLLTTYTLLTDDPIENKPLAFISKELSQELQLSTGLDIWDNDNVNLANEISGIVTKLSLMLHLIGALKDIPDLTSSGFEKLKEFMNCRSKELSDLIQLFVDKSSNVFNMFNKIPASEKEKHPNLLTAITLLTDVYKKVFPSDDFENQEDLNLDSIAQYAERVQNAVNSFEIIRLNLIADALEYF